MQHFEGFETKAAGWIFEDTSGKWMGQDTIRILSRHKSSSLVHVIKSMSFRRNMNQSDAAENVDS